MTKNERRRARYASDPEYRRRMIEMAHKSRDNNPLKTLAWQRRSKGVDLSTVRRAEVDQRCEICGQREDRSTPLRLDHNHQTGAFRGWLCSPCNTGIGQLRDDPEVLVAGARYLRGQ